MAQHTEVPPATASVVFESSYEWGDADWLAQRATKQAHQEPMAAYEVHLGSWRPGLSYVELADQLLLLTDAVGGVLIAVPENR